MRSANITRSLTTTLVLCCAPALSRGQAAQTFLIHGTPRSCSAITQLDSALADNSQQFFFGWNEKDYADAAAWSQSCADYGWHVAGRPRLPLLQEQHDNALRAGQNQVAGTATAEVPGALLVQGAAPAVQAAAAAVQPAEATQLSLNAASGPNVAPASSIAPGPGAASAPGGAAAQSAAAAPSAPIQAGAAAPAPVPMAAAAAGAAPVAAAAASADPATPMAAAAAATLVAAPAMTAASAPVATPAAAPTLVAAPAIATPAAAAAQEPLLASAAPGIPLTASAAQTNVAAQAVPASAMVVAGGGRGASDPEEESVVTGEYFKKHFHQESLWVANRAHLDIGEDHGPPTWPTGGTSAELKNRLTADKIVLYCARKTNASESSARQPTDPNNQPLLWDWRWCEAEEAAAYNRLVTGNEFPSAGRGVVLGCAGSDSYIYTERCIQTLIESAKN
jgi:hypothetical protein